MPSRRRHTRQSTGRTGRPHLRLGHRQPRARAQATSSTSGSLPSRVHQLVHLVADLLVQDSREAAQRALDALTEAVGTPRRTLGALVEAHGARVIGLLGEARRTVPGVEALLARHAGDTGGFTMTAARTLARKLGPRRALGVLVERYGPRVVELLRPRAQRGDRVATALLEMQPSRPSGRPKGSPTRKLAPLCFAAATLVDELGVQPAELLRALGRDASSGSADYGWLRPKLAEGRRLREGEWSGVATFNRVYYQDDQRGLLKSLIPDLMPGARPGQSGQQGLAALTEIAGVSVSAPQ